MLVLVCLAIVLSILLIGCATPGVAFTDKDSSIEITPTEGSSWFAWLLGSNLPAGDYECQFDEHKSAKFSTKTDLKLFDLNASKIGD